MYNITLRNMCKPTCMIVLLSFKLLMCFVSLGDVAIRNQEKSPKDRRNSFLRRTKATAPPLTTDTETATATNTETTTSTVPGKFRRGQSKFKSRKEAEGVKRVEGAGAKRDEGAGANRVEGAGVNRGEGAGANRVEGERRPSLGGARRSERPTRTFVRRRLGGANSTTTTAAPVSTSSVATRRPFRVASRRRPIPVSSTTTTSTTEAPSDPTAGLNSEESLQDLEDTDVIEDPTLDPQVTAPKKTFKIPRRPLVNLKEEVHDQNPSATNEDERKRQSKKYSATFKQNQLDEVLRQKAKSQEELDYTTERKTTAFDDFNPETSVAIAAHQLFAAPLPSIPNFDDEDTKPTKKSPSLTTQYYTNSETDPYTNTRKTVYFDEDFTSTPVYKSSTQDYVATGPAYTGLTVDFDSPKVPPTTSFSIPKSTFSTSTFAAKERLAVPTPTIINTGLSGVAPTRGVLSRGSTTSGITSGLPRGTRPGLSSVLPPESSTPRFASTSEKLIPVPVEDYAFSTGGYSGASQEPSYFTREYLLESPVTKTYDDEYQYLSPVTTPITTTRKTFRKKIQRKISTTIKPTTAPVSPVTTAKPPRRGPPRTPKPFEKVKPAPSRTYKPIENYDYYDDSAEKVAEKYIEGTKVVLHAKGTIECLDQGNFPHPTSCKKFISCSRMETGSLIGWEYICPKGLSFDPVGGICNWSAGLGCDEKDV